MQVEGVGCEGRSILCQPGVNCRSRICQPGVNCHSRLFQPGVNCRSRLSQLRVYCTTYSCTLAVQVEERHRRKTEGLAARLVNQVKTALATKQKLQERCVCL